MLTDAQQAQFQTEGYFILTDFFNLDDIDRATEQIDVFDAERERELTAVGKEGISRANEINFTAHLAERNPVLKAFCCQPKLVALMNELIGLDVSLYWDQSVYKRPEALRDFPWHQDNGYTPVIPEQYITCWIPLNDATLENGCIWIQPGTHLQGTVEHVKTELGWQCYHGQDPGTPVPLKKGDVVVFSSLLFHRSGPNCTNGMRKAYVVQYCSADTVNAKTRERVGRFVVSGS